MLARGSHLTKSRTEMARLAQSNHLSDGRAEPFRFGLSFPLSIERISVSTGLISERTAVKSIANRSPPTLIRISDRSVVRIDPFDFDGTTTSFLAMVGLYLFSVSRPIMPLCNYAPPHQIAVLLRIPNFHEPLVLMLKNHPTFTSHQPCLIMGRSCTKRKLISNDAASLHIGRRTIPHDSLRNGQRRV